MNQRKYVFAQLVDFLPKAQFDYIVKKYNANKGIRSFTYWNQTLIMLFSNRLRYLLQKRSFFIKIHFYSGIIKNKYYLCTMKSTR